jgi:hypothetical protein
LAFIDLLLWGFCCGRRELGVARKKLPKRFHLDREPNLVLNCVAAVRSFFREGFQTKSLQALLLELDFFFTHHLDAQMVYPARKSLLIHFEQREIQMWFFEIEFRVALYLLLRSNAEHFVVEGDRLLYVTDVERKMRTHMFSLNRKKTIKLANFLLAAAFCDDFLTAVVCVFFRTALLLVFTAGRMLNGCFAILMSHDRSPFS